MRVNFIWVCNAGGLNGGIIADQFTGVMYLLIGDKVTPLFNADGLPRIYEAALGGGGDDRTGVH